MRSLPELRRWDDPAEPLAALLDRGGIVGFATESSYGLGADPRHRGGVDGIFRVKGRPADRPLPVVVANLEQIRELGGRLEEAEEAGLIALWPAPLTILLPLARPLPAAAGSTRLGFRIPAHERLRELLLRLGRGLTATSANRSGEPPLLEADPVRRLLAEREAAVIDGGALAGGEPSTVVALERGALRVLRRGRFPLERLPLPKGLESAGAPPRNRSGSSRC